MKHKFKVGDYVEFWIMGQRSWGRIIEVAEFQVEVISKSLLWGNARINIDNIIRRDARRSR